MKVQILSDLHLEFFRGDLKGQGTVSIHPDAEVVVLAGDIHLGKQSLEFAAELHARCARPVLWVPGNHEYYGQDHEKLSQGFSRSRKPGVHVLTNKAVVLDGVRFCGGTLWTDFLLYAHAPRLPGLEAALDVAEQFMNDFRVIRKGDARFSALDSRREHLKTLKFLTKTLATPFEGKTVVVTHHAPHPKSIHPRFAPGERVLNSTFRLPEENSSWMANPCFASNLESLVQQADAWIHGHTHDSFDYRVGKCQVVANPRGYPVRGADNKLYFENIHHDPLKLLDV